MDNNQRLDEVTVDNEGCRSAISVVNVNSQNMGAHQDEISTYSLFLLADLAITETFLIIRLPQISLIFILLINNHGYTTPMVYRSRRLRHHFCANWIGSTVLGETKYDLPRMKYHN